MISTPSLGIARSRWLPVLLGEPVAWHPIWPFGRAVAGWGRKPSFYRARLQARIAGLPVWSLEDGFIRSVGVGTDEPALSVVVDDLGIFYDARSPSRLETLIGRCLSPEEKTRASALVARWRASRVSKYNHAPDLVAPLPTDFVLVADQTYGDASVVGGLADASSFDGMLEAALTENANMDIVVKVHPEVVTGRKRGYFDLDALSSIPRVVVLGDDVHPVSLIERARTVYTVTSQIGFEALLWGRPVRVFGMPFYAGWGLTEDDLPPPTRRHRVSIDQLVHAALVDYVRYVDPETGRRCEAERLIDYLALQRREHALLPRSNFHRFLGRI